MQIDAITWKTLVFSSMKALYGIVGEARHFDVLQRLKSAPRAIIRVHRDDADLFVASFMAYAFKLNRHLGDTYFTEACIRVAKRAAFLGLVVDDSYR